MYTGITTNLKRRLDEHNSANKGAAYTRSRRPVKLVYTDTCINRSLASRREYTIKKLSKAAKERLVKRDQMPAPGDAGPE
ncbi:MAG: GIY-YIG nuclease family protein [Granulosicoccus sp.]|nr:GIY-YIG nuclease family protein [Granulosicoccus sp.]